MNTLIALYTAIAVLGTAGFYKLYKSVKNITTYKDQAKKEKIEMPMKGFCQLPVTPKSSSISFFRINDGVMGGKSKSELKEYDGLEFSGEINTNGGGFASFRSLGIE